MAERDTFVTVSDGDQLNEGYFNGNYNYVNGAVLLVDVMTEDTTEVTHTGNTDFTTKKTYTFTPTTSRNIILGIKLTLDLKNSSASDDTEARLAVSIPYTTRDQSVQYETLYSRPCYNDDDEETYETNSIWMPTGSTYIDGSNDMISFGQLMGQSSYSIAVQLQTGDAGETAYATNIILEVYYIDNPIVNTNSGKFS